MERGAEAPRSEDELVGRYCCRLRRLAAHGEKGADDDDPDEQDDLADQRVRTVGLP